MKRYSLGLLLAGMGLIAGSCVPLVQTITAHVDAAHAPELTLPPAGGAATLKLDAAVTAVPVVTVAPLAASPSSSPLSYTLTITDASGGNVLRRDGDLGEARPANGGPGAAGPVELRFDELTFAPGTWTVAFWTTPADPPPAAIDFRLVSASPGLIPGLLTALMLAILGWLAASLGAFQWIRAEASRPVPDAEGARRESGEPERIWIVGCHLSALIGYVLPFGHLLGPSLIWFSRRRVYPGVERAGREVLNFQLSVTLYVLVGLFLSFFLIGVVVLFLIVVFHFCVVLYAALRAQRAAEVRYPLSIRII